MEEVVEITESQLAAALKKWEADAAANNRPQRSDASRHIDNARYLIGLMRSA